jgi:hypothetical protein
MLIVKNLKSAVSVLDVNANNRLRVLPINKDEYIMFDVSIFVISFLRYLLLRTSDLCCANSLVMHVQMSCAIKEMIDIIFSP